MLSFAPLIDLVCALDPTPNSPPSTSSCLCLPILGLAVAAVVWLLIKATRTKKPIAQERAPTPEIPVSPPISTPRATAPERDRFVEVSPGVTVQRSPTTLSYSFESRASRFIKDAEKFHEVEGKPIEPVPFMQYWPTFQALNEQQKRWYFYWRSEVRQGRYPSTPLSYIFIYVYELLCLVELPNPSAAAEQVRTIWRQYRETYPELDRYLPEWGGDLLSARSGTPESVEWWNTLLREDGFSPPDVVVNMVLEKAVEDGRVADLPYALWSRLNVYQPKNKFYQRYNADGAVDTAYLAAIRAIDGYFSSLKAKKGLLERYVSAKLYPQTKRAFMSAIVPDDFPDRIELGEARNYTKSSRLGNLLLSITKYTENILRKQKRFAGRVSGFELEEKLQKVLEETFASPEEKQPIAPVHITFDPERIRTLQEESELVSAMLNIETEEDAPPLYNNIVEVRALWDKLSVPEKLLLLAIHTHRVDEMGQITASVVDAGTLPRDLVSHVNALSLSFLGDQIISIEGPGKVTIADDFVDEMDLIAAETPVESLQTGQRETVCDTEEDGWRQFLQQLSPQELDLITMFTAKGSLREEEIHEFARLGNQMGNLLIDSLNEKAIEELGRTPFYPDDGYWFIEEEDLVTLRETVQIEGA